MIKKLLLGFGGALLLIVGIIYISIRAIRYKPGFPDNVILSAPPAPGNWRGVDSVLLKASDLYVAGAYRHLLLGKNYRKAWDAPVMAPIVWLDTLHGGLTPVKAGGGGQTRSLILSDPQGRMFTLRSVCKDPSRSLVTFAKFFKLENMVIDGTSAGHPYAAVAAAKLCEAADILHNQPRVVFLPEQPALDTFNELFANRLYTLEYDQEGKNGDWTGVGGNKSVLLVSEELQDLLLENPLHRADQATLLRARLLDLAIDDWDRHPGNWGWITKAEAQGVVYVPFPVDRDMAFYGAGGIAPWLLNRPGALGKFRPFFRKKKYLQASFHKSRYVDPFFLNELTREEFMQAATKLQQQLTDERIAQAFQIWPDTIYKLDAPEIIAKVIDRKNDLPEIAEVFYEHLAHQPQIMGTHQVDSFVVQQVGDRQVMVSVYSATEKGKMVRKYQRTFLENETKSIALFGWDGNDLLDVRGTLSIPINFIGGKGDDRLVPSQSLPSNKSNIVVMDKHDTTVPDGYKVKKKSIKANLPRA